MKQTKTIRSNWASLTLTPDGGVIVGVKPNGKQKNYAFASLESLKENLNNTLQISRWIVAVPRNLCIIKEISLPASSMEEATQMAEYEISSILPVSADEVVFGCLPLESRDNRFNVAVCVLPRIKLESFLKPITEAGIQPDRIVLSSMSLHNWFDNSPNASGDHKSIIAAVDVFQCEVITCMNGTIYKSNHVNYDHIDLDKRISSIQTEILEHHNKLPFDAKDAPIWLIGKDELALAIKREFSGDINIQVVKKDDLPQLRIDDGTDTDEENNIYETVLAESLLDIAIKSHWPYFNLMPINVAKTYKKKLELRNYIATGLLGIMFIFMSWMSLRVMNYRMEKGCNQIEKEISKIEGMATNIESKQQQIKAIENQIKK